MYTLYSTHHFKQIQTTKAKYLSSRFVREIERIFLCTYYAYLHFSHCRFIMLVQFALSISFVYLRVLINIQNKILLFTCFYASLRTWKKRKNKQFLINNFSFWFCVFQVSTSQFVCVTFNEYSMKKCLTFFFFF